jgi:2,4-dienoyl-CoA reductase-like NADH-dependent reductase (Old Yellow Enzyme family)
VAASAVDVLLLIEIIESDALTNIIDRVVCNARSLKTIPRKIYDRPMISLFFGRSVVALINFSARIKLSVYPGGANFVAKHRCLPRAKRSDKVIFTTEPPCATQPDSGIDLSIEPVATSRQSNPQTMHVTLSTPLTLPNGSTLPNRLAKAAMEENMAAPGQLPGADLFRLYRAWAKGGAGLIITGNVMVDGRALTGPGGIVLEANTPLAAFEQWAQEARSHGAQVWMQSNHPGRQVMAAMGGVAWGPSAVALDLGKHSKLFAQPHAMTEAEIQATIVRFADTAVAAERAGFTGVEVHAAHGYLLSQFLSPLTNQRSDQWGGSLPNRARLVLDVVRAVRARVQPGFCVAVKLNSADFQRGGFSEDDAQHVIGWLNALAVDMVELSGGSYESPAMQGRTADGRTLAREAYFLEFATRLAQAAQMPVMTTGGIRRKAVAQQVLDSGVAVAGMATALASQPDLPARWLAGEDAGNAGPQVQWKDKTLAALATMALVKRQLRSVGAGHTGVRSYSPVLTLIIDQLRTRRLTARYRRWRTAA